MAERNNMENTIVVDIEEIVAFPKVARVLP